MDGNKHIFLKCTYADEAISASAIFPITEINFYRMPTKTHKEIIRAADDDVEPVSISFYPSSSYVKTDEKIGRRTQKKILIYYGDFDLSQELFGAPMQQMTCLVRLL